MHLCYEESPLSISKQSAGHVHAPSGEKEGTQHPLVDDRNVCRVSTTSSRVPRFIPSWCHMWSLLSFTRRMAIFSFRSLVRTPAPAHWRNALHDANRQVLRRSQHLHPSDPFLLPAMWRRSSKHDSRCTRSRCKSPDEQLRGGVCL